MCEGLFDEQVARRAAHRLQHPGITDATLTQTLHQALAGTLGGHTDTVNIDRTHAETSCRDRGNIPQGHHYSAGNSGTGTAPNLPAYPTMLHK